MRRAIVTTTIHKPTKAIKLFIAKKGWDVIIIGDKKTPHASYRQIERKHQNVLYLSPQDQEKKHKKLSDLLGWNCTTRRNIGFIEAYRLGAAVMATVDDDNIPYPHWGSNVLVGTQQAVEVYDSKTPVFDPLSVTEHKQIWHRGYPIELLSDRLHVRHVGQRQRKILVQADLWNGDPDIDAVVRLVLRPHVTFAAKMTPFSSDKLCPFNSQNTFLAREAIPYYGMVAHVGRIEDIWASYILQYHLPGSVVYSKASVFQDRNEHDIVRNLEDEMVGYKQNYSFVLGLDRYMKLLPKVSVEAMNEYRRIIAKYD